MPPYAGWELEDDVECAGEHNDVGGARIEFYSWLILAVDAVYLTPCDMLTYVLQ
jgi:hypothetical protein